MPVLPVTGYLRYFRGTGRTCILDLNAGESKAPVRMMGDERETDFPQFPPYGMRALPSASVTLVRGGWRRRSCAGNCHSPGDKCTKDLGFPQASHTPGEKCAAELDFPRASLTLGECCAEELGYIRPALLAEAPVYAWTVTGSLLFGSPHRRVRGECCAEELGYIRPALLAEAPVYAWTVTGSLLFGSPHRRVRGCYRSTLLCHLRVDGLVTLNCHQPSSHRL